MWDVISGDFDESIKRRSMCSKCNIKCKTGSIIVCHDSEKAFPRLKILLPAVLELF